MAKKRISVHGQTAPQVEEPQEQRQVSTLQSLLETNPLDDVKHEAMAEAGVNAEPQSIPDEQPNEKTIRTESINEGPEGMSVTDKEKEVTYPQESDYTENQDIFNKYFTKPLTPKQVEQRKRAATAVDAVGHLGNLIQSIGNAVNTDRNAPSLDNPMWEGAGTAIRDFEDRTKRAQAAYIDGLAGAKNADRGLYDRDYNRIWQEQQARIRQEQWAKELEADKEETAAKLAETERHNRAMEGYNETRANAALNNSQASQTRANAAAASAAAKAAGTNVNRSTKKMSINDGAGKTYEVDMNKVNDDTLRQFYNRIPQEFISSDRKYSVPSYVTPTEAKSSRIEAIMAYAEQNPNYLAGLAQDFSNAFTLAVDNSKEDLSFAPSAQSSGVSQDGGSFKSPKQVK